MHTGQNGSTSSGTPTSSWELKMMWIVRFEYSVSFAMISLLDTYVTGLFGSSCVKLPGDEQTDNTNSSGNSARLPPKW